MRDVGPAAAADDGDDDDDGLTSRPPERRAADVDAPGRMHEVLESSRGLAAAFNAHRTGRFVDDFSSGLHRRGRARRPPAPSSSSRPRRLEDRRCITLYPPRRRPKSNSEQFKLATTL